MIMSKNGDCSLITRARISLGVMRSLVQVQSPRFMVFYVYILQSCKDGGLYIGHTQNIDDRLRRHNSPDRRTYTAKRGPWKLVHSEEHQTRSQAIQRERFLKSHAGSREKKMLASVCTNQMLGQAQLQHRPDKTSVGRGAVW